MKRKCSLQQWRASDTINGTVELESHRTSGWSFQKEYLRSVKVSATNYLLVTKESTVTLEQKSQTDTLTKKSRWKGAILEQTNIAHLLATSRTVKGTAWLGWHSGQKRTNRNKPWITMKQTQREDTLQTMSGLRNKTKGWATLFQIKETKLLNVILDCSTLDCILQAEIIAKLKVNNNCFRGKKWANSRPKTLQNNQMPLNSDQAKGLF